MAEAEKQSLSKRICTQQHMSAMAENTSPTKSPFTALNDDCLIAIFRQLPIEDRIRVERGISLMHIFDTFALTLNN